MAAAKPYKLTIEKRPEYLYARVKSESSRPTIALEYLKEITEKCREADCTKLIIDSELRQSFLVWDMFAVATQFPNLATQCTKVAIIDKHAPIEKKELSVVVGAQCGLDVHVFNELNAAENWLLKH